LLNRFKIENNFLAIFNFLKKDGEAMQPMPSFFLFFPY